MTPINFILRAALLGTATTASAMAATPRASLDAVVSKDMNYAQFRKAVLDAQWVPVADPQCDGNVYGAEGGPGNAANICTQLPELEACSGDGYCSMYFEHQSSGTKVHVVTYGDYSRWNLPGEQDDLAVVEWSYQ